MVMLGMVMSCGCSVCMVVLKMVCLGSVGEDSVSCIIGMLDVEYLIISGGVMLGGSWCNCDCMEVIIWVMVVWMLVLGWKNILIMVILVRDCDLMCLMLFIIVVSLCLFWVVMCWFIFWVDRLL